MNTPTENHADRQRLIDSFTAAVAAAVFLCAANAPSQQEALRQQQVAQFKQRIAGLSRRERVELYHAVVAQQQQQAAAAGAAAAAAQLQRLVTRDCMIGTQLPLQPSSLLQHETSVASSLQPSS